MNSIEGICLTETDKDIINILFINNNHFEILVKKDYKKNELVSSIIKKINFRNIITII